MRFRRRGPGTRPMMKTPKKDAIVA
jgi:hypothetical protein